MGLSDSQCEQYQEFFSTFDQDEEGENTGFIDPQKFKSFIRALGFNPTEAVLNEYLTELKNKPKITFDDTKPYIEKQVAGGKDNADDLIEAFKIFDKEGMGLISIQELRHILGNMAEKFSEQELNDCCTAIDDGSGHINYRDLVKQILA